MAKEAALGDWEDPVCPFNGITRKATLAGAAAAKACCQQVRQREGGSGEAQCSANDVPLREVQDLL